MSTSSAFWSQVLALIGAPVTQNNIDVLSAWSAHEGTSASWNPLATTQGTGTNFNSTGVKNFATAAAGEQATANTLMNGRYGHIVAALRHDVPLSTWLQGGAGVGAELKVWSGGGYSSLPNAPSYDSPAFGGGGGLNLAGQAGSGAPQSTPAGGCKTIGEAYASASIPVVSGIPLVGGTQQAVQGFIAWITQRCVYLRLAIQLGSLLFILYGLKFAGQAQPLNVATAPLRAVRKAV